MGWLRSDLMALREERPTFTMFFEEHRAKTPLSEKGKQHVEKLLRVADSLIPENSGYLFREFTLIGRMDTEVIDVVDAELTYMLHRLVINGHEVPPKILKYAKDLWNRPSIAEFVNHERGVYVPYVFFN